MATFRTAAAVALTRISLADTAQAAALHEETAAYRICVADLLVCLALQMAEGWKIILLLRLSPIVPWNLLNIAMASTNVPFWQFTIASAIGTQECASVETK